MNQIYLKLDKETTAKSDKCYAQKHRLTINTLMQGVWSYLLHRYTGNNDVVLWSNSIRTSG